MASEDQLRESKQRTFTNWKAQVLSYPLREAMLGILNPGVVCGFDTLHLYPDAPKYKLGLSHEKTGVKKTIYVDYGEGYGTGESVPTGVLVSGFGTIIHSEEEVGVEVLGNAEMPTRNGYYMIYAYYNRHTGIGPEPNDRVYFYLNPDLIKEYNGPDDTIEESDVVGPNKLTPTMIPVTFILVKDGEYLLLSDLKTDGEWGHSYDRMGGDDGFYNGMMSKLDMMTCFGTYGVGRFKYLGRTLDSIAKYINKALLERDQNREQWRQMLHKLNMSSGKLEEPYNEIPMDNSTVPEEYIDSRDEFGKPIYKEPTFIKEVFSVWLDLLILDQECSQLWDKLGYPETQPETEKVLLITKTVWDNMLALKAHSELLASEIWQRLGLQSTGDPDGPADAWGILNKAEKVWNNLMSIVDKLGKLDDFVRKDKDGVSDNLERIWATIGYEKGVSSATEGPLATTMNIWDNLKALYNYVTLNVERSNELNIRQEQARERGVESPLKICSKPWFLNREPTLEEIVEYRKTFVWEITNIPQTDTTASVREYELYVDVPYQDIDEYVEPEQRVGFIIWRPDQPGKKLYFQNVITQVKPEDGSELFLNNGGMAMLYKVTKADTQWHLQILNPGAGEAKVETSPGLLPGYKYYDYNSVTTGIPNSGQGQVNYRKVTPFVQGYISIDTTVGMHLIDVTSMGTYISNRGNTWNKWGSDCAIPLKISRPRVVGEEIIIKLFGLLTEPSSSLNNADPVSGPSDKALKSFSINAVYTGTMQVNFSLPVDTVDTVYPDAYWKTYAGPDGKTGIITLDYSISSYLKWPGDWVRLRAEENSNGELVWRIIENFRNPDVFMLIAQARIGSGAGSEDSYKYRLNQGFPNWVGPISSEVNIPFFGHRTSKNSLNSYIAIVSRNHIRYQQFEIFNSKKNYGYAFSSMIPFPYPIEVGQTRPNGDVDSERGRRFYWLINPVNDTYGVLGVINNDTNRDGDDEDYHMDAGWDFPLGGPLVAFRNYVFHNLIL